MPFSQNPQSMRTHARAASTAIAGRLHLLLGVGLLIGVGGVSGCASLWKCPVSDDVVSARQISLRGVDAMQREEWEEAETLFRKALRTCPTDERAHRCFAEILWRKGATQDAIAHMREAARLSGEPAEATIALGEMHLAREELTAAAKCAREALAYRKDLPAAWMLLGNVQRLEGDLQPALNSFHRALSLRPEDARLQLTVAQVYRQLNRPQRTLAVLAALTEQYPAGEEPRDVLVEQGLALRAVGDYNGSAAALAQAIERGPIDAELLCQLGESQLLAGDPGNARLSVLAALDRDSSHAIARTLYDELSGGDAEVAATPAASRAQVR
jgi:tetratricopeptide (TPR) repeat protein